MLTNEQYEKIGVDYDALSEEYWVSVDRYRSKYLGKDGKILWYKREEAQADFNDLHAIFLVQQDEMFAKHGTTLDEFIATVEAHSGGTARRKDKAEKVNGECNEDK